ncbi:hypothetical protein [Paludisphaera soli]|uniref:hypothetical protein n=1 Tax=Paludisphaera soli TaxID=2712865 RepID=UPI0013EB5E0B|nr:hypothetical protein [Paludisphaera soli]
MGWQDAVAIGVVIGAALYLLGLVWRGVAGEKSAGCGSACGKCSSAAGEPIVTIGPAPSAKPGGRPEAAGRS